MKTFFLLTAFLFSALTFGQTDEKLLNKVSDYVCECLENSSKQLETNALAAKTNCVQDAVDRYMDPLLKVYGDELLNGEEIGKFISNEISEELYASCEIYKPIYEFEQNNPVFKTESYTTDQQALIIELAKKGCTCSEDEIKTNPQKSFQEVMETCLQNTLTFNTEVLSETFDGFLTDQIVMNNVAVSIAKSLVEDCEMYKSGIVASSQTPSSPSFTGKIKVIDNSGDYLNVTLADDTNAQLTFYVANAFNGSEEFIRNLPTLNKNETPVTLLVIEKELYFKSLNENKRVYTIESVKY